MPKARLSDRISRWHALLLYPDAEDYNCDEVLHTLQMSGDCECVWILHDQDPVEQTEDEQTEDEQTEDEQTEDCKKAHIHLLLYTPLQMTSKAITFNLGIAQRYCKSVSNGIDFVLYMCHFGQWGKHRYSCDLLQGTPRLVLRAQRRVCNAYAGYSAGFGESPCEVYQLIVEWLDAQQGTVSIRQLYDTAMQLGIMGQVLRNAGVYERICQFHNAQWQTAEVDQLADRVGKMLGEVKHTEQLLRKELEDGAFALEILKSEVGIKHG